jgi:mercuric ion transport protein
VRQIVRMMTDKVGVVGTVVSSMACAMCFPALGAIGAAIGLGFLSRWEHVFIDVLPLFAALVLIANGLGWLAHRQWHRGGLGMIGPILVLIGWVSFMSEVLAPGAARVVLYTGLVVMVVFAVVDLVVPSRRRCGPERCEVPAQHR